MTDMAHCFESAPLTSKIPLLQSMVGSTIEKAIRYSWLAPNEATAEYSLQESQLFSLTAGALAIELSNSAIIAFASQSSLVSVICWQERTQDGKWGNERLDQDIEFFPISASDPKYSNSYMRGILGRSVIGFTVWQCPPVDEDYNDLPREVALQLTLSGEMDLWLTHGLHDNSDDFSVLEETQICPDLRAVLFKHVTYP